ncbi:MAG: hypothetical protein V1809_13835 [Planctomycetota bacterium]
MEKMTETQSIWTSKTDRFWTKKFIFGVLFTFAVCYLGLSVAAIFGVYHPHSGYIATAPYWSGIISLVVAAICLVAFRNAEKQRREQVGK